MKIGDFLMKLTWELEKYPELKEAELIQVCMADSTEDDNLIHKIRVHTRLGDREYMHVLLDDDHITHVPIAKKINMWSTK